MSIGNTMDNGNKGSNFPYQRAVTKLLSEIACSTASPSSGGATELTLLAVLSSLQNGKEFEQSIVTDLGGVGTPTYLQVRIFDIDTQTFSAPVYYDASGAVVIPVGPVELVNPQLVLNNILTQISSLNTKFLEVTRTPSYIQATAAGVIAAGARSVSVYNSGTTSGTWLGTAIQPGVQLNFDAGGEDDVLAAFVYTASATATLEIATIV